MSEKDVSPSEETITGGQIVKLTDVIAAKLRKSGLPRDASQQVIELQGAEIAEKVVGDFCTRVEAYQRATEPHILKRQPFDPVKFIGKGWTIDEQVGERTGDNLDAGEIVRKDYLKSGESSINGEERLKRIKAAPGDVQLDADDFLALYEEKGQLTLRWLYETKSIARLSFWGTILQDPDGDRRVLYLDRREGGSWDWDCDWVDSGHWDDGLPAGVLASSN
jgi:hypothetical protein